MTTSMTPYLFFGGRGEEAIEFYKTKLGGSVEMVMRFSDSPDPAPEGMIPPGFENKIMHASMTIQGCRIMISDGCSPDEKFTAFRLAMALPTEAECHGMFNALAEGGKVEMPLMKTFWSPCYGMVTDKFGLGWMVMITDQPT